ncbi:hypothetical protein ACX1NA_01855 [Mycoplasma sp. VS276A1]
MKKLRKILLPFTIATIGAMPLVAVQCQQSKNDTDDNKNPNKEKGSVNNPEYQNEDSVLEQKYDDKLTNLIYNVDSFMKSNEVKKSFNLSVQTESYLIFGDQINIHSDANINYKRAIQSAAFLKKLKNSSQEIKNATINLWNSVFEIPAAFLRLQINNFMIPDESNQPTTPKNIITYLPELATSYLTPISTDETNPITKLTNFATVDFDLNDILNETNLNSLSELETKFEEKNNQIVEKINKGLIDRENLPMEKLTINLKAKITLNKSLTFKQYAKNIIANFKAWLKLIQPQAGENNNMPLNIEGILGQLNNALALFEQVPDAELEKYIPLTKEEIESMQSITKALKQFAGMYIEFK